MKKEKKLTKITYNILKKWALNEIKQYEKFINNLNKEYENNKK